MKEAFCVNVNAMKLEPESADAAEILAESEQIVPAAYSIVKRIFDFCFSLAAVIILSPLMLILSIVIKLTSKGPAVYKQRRVGYGGKLFTIYKFRTMVNGADKLDSHLTTEQLAFYKINRKLEDDPRITKFGGFLRKTSLDELPQLFNILKGDMSLVGPRPMLSEEKSQYGDFYYYYIKVLPGLTGLWQVKNRHNTVMQERAKLDREYINHLGIPLDLKIIFLTAKVVLLKKGA